MDGMTDSAVLDTRVDLFTHIHKAIRAGLFEIGVLAGATDWSRPEDVARLEASWAQMTELLHSHTEHEDRYIFRLLDGTPAEGLLLDDDHRELDALLADLEREFPALRGDGDRLRWYRDLHRYVAMTLQHLHEEETVLLPALWAHRSDEELLACRAAFLAETPQTVAATTLRLARQAIDPATRRALGLPD